MLVFAIVFFSIKPIKAQIESLYDNNAGAVAGINSLMSAVASNDLNGVKFFAKAGRVLINQKNLGGATSLHLACREGNFEIVKVLIENGADVNVVDNEGWTPLMRAALAGNQNITALLLDQKAIASKTNLTGESAIIHAALSNCNECLNFMFEKFDFIQNMDIRLLKEQLTEAFVIARNHENEVMQGLLTSYLDRVIKAEPLIKEKDQSTPPIPSLENKVFKIKKDETEEEVVYTKPIVPIANPNAVFNESILPVTKSSAQSPIPMIVKNNEGNNTVVKKFKFISGPSGQVVTSVPKYKKKYKAVVKPKTVYKFKGDCYCDKKQ